MAQEFTLSKKQFKTFGLLRDKKHTEIIYGGAAGGGKSALGCFWLIHACNNYPGSRWVLGRSKLKTLRETTLQTFFELISMFNYHPAINYNQQRSVIEWSNGSEIILKDLFYYPSDPNYDSLGSLEITGAFIDECNQITYKAWQVLKSRIRYKLDEHGLIPKILGTCNPSKNWVYNDFYQPFKTNNLKDYRAFIPALVHDNPFISKHYIDNLISLSDKNTKERLLNGNWEYDDDPATLMHYDSIQDIFNCNREPVGEKTISVDVARLGEDKTVISVIQDWIVIDIEIRGKQDTSKTIERIKHFQQEYQIPNSKVTIDEDGVGGGVKDQIPNSKGFVNNSKARKYKGKDENYSNLKSQCYFHLARLVNQGKVGMTKKCYSKVVEGRTIRELLSEELGAVKRKDVDKDSKLAIIGKDKVKEIIGRSPDISDSLMMNMIFEFSGGKFALV